MSSVCGLLVVDKPAGPTSHDIVSSARRLWGTREVGHAGTLDPLATGVLVLLFGEATKLSGFLTLDDKSYRAEVSFGRSTDTLDSGGAVTAELRIPPGALTAEAVEAALEAERERTTQVPPAVSAIRRDGVRAHRAHRKGEPLELELRQVAVRRLDLVELAGERLTVELSASKGYYVRALARDLGAALGVPAHLSALRRLASGVFDLSRSVAWPPEAPAPLIGLAEAASAALPTALLTADGEKRARLGQPLCADHFARRPGAERTDRPEAWLSPSGSLVALGSETAPGEFRVLRGFGAG